MTEEEKTNSAYVEEIPINYDLPQAKEQLGLFVKKDFFEGKPKKIEVLGYREQYAERFGKRRKERILSFGFEGDSYQIQINGNNKNQLFDLLGFTIGEWFGQLVLCEASQEGDIEVTMGDGTKQTVPTYKLHFTQ